MTAFDRVTAFPDGGFVVVSRRNLLICLEFGGIGHSAHRAVLSGIFLVAQLVSHFPRVQVWARCPSRSWHPEAARIVRGWGVGGARTRTVGDWAGGGRPHCQGLGGGLRYGRWRGTWQRGGVKICIYIYIVYIGISCYTFTNICLYILYIFLCRYVYEKLLLLPPAPFLLLIASWLADLLAVLTCYTCLLSVLAALDCCACLLKLLAVWACLLALLAVLACCACAFCA